MIYLLDEQMYIFLFGKNPDISKLEIWSQFKNKSDAVFYSDKYALVETQNELELIEISKKLAGTIKVGKLVFTTESLKDNFINNFDFYYPKNFQIYLTSLLEDELVNNFIKDFKKDLKSEKLKGNITNISKTPLKSSKNHSNSPDSTLDLSLVKIGTNYLFFKTIQFIDSSRFKFLDQNRPSKKITHGTSFRLATMMINILNLNENDLFVDPYCGTGTFLMLGMINNLNVIGIDNDTQLIGICKANCKWIEKEFMTKSSYKIIYSQSEKTKFEGKPDGIIFEPYMGPFLKNLPSEKEAKITVDKLYRLYSAMFRNLYKHVARNCKVVCILPDFLTDEGKLIPLPRDIFRQTKFLPVEIEFNEEKIDQPFNYEAADGSKIVRNLWILEKKD